MLKGLWGKKIGMTQAFVEGNVLVPVTVVDVSGWIVTQIKTVEKDGYLAIQVGIPRDRYRTTAFSSEWLKDQNTYFLVMREIECDALPEGIAIGNQIRPEDVVKVGSQVGVTGITKGRGFQGVVKRHDFSGGRASHGPRFGRIPGSLSFMRSQGRVIKGKKLPGHMGAVQRTIRNIAVVQIMAENGLVLLKGSVPGGARSFVYVAHS